MKMINSKNNDLKITPLADTETNNREHIKNCYCIQCLSCRNIM